MILALDVGNTNITCGVFDGDRIKASFRITTKMPRTSDEYGMLLSTLLERNQVGMDDIHDAIICSVVPNIMHSLQNGLIKYFNIRPIIVEAGIKTGIRIATPNPQQIGADRIVDAVAAYELYGGPVLVIDFGTATTYDMVDENGTFMGGITAPGIRISAKALWEDAAKLPEIEIKKPDNILGKDTITSMQAGLVYGQIGQTEYIINKVKEETGMYDAKVVVTGGLGRIISNETENVDVYDPDLTLKGINLVYRKQNRKGVKQYYGYSSDTKASDRKCDTSKQPDTGTYGRRDRPAISLIVQGAGSRPFMYGNGQRQGNFVQKQKYRVATFNR